MTSISKISRNRPILGTFVEITAFQNSNCKNFSAEKIAEIIKKTYQKIEQLEAILSAKNKSSAISNLNNAGHLKNPPIELLTIIKISNFLSRLTSGLFDISAASQLNGSFENIAFSPQEICFTKNLQIDLGGIAKGYITDLAAKFLLNHGIQNAVINAGGDIRILGKMPQPIHVRNPFEPSKYFDLGNFANCAIASSSITLASKNRGGKSQVALHKKLNRQKFSDEKIVHATVISNYSNYCCTFADALTKPFLLGWNAKNLKKIDYLLFNEKAKILTNIKHAL